MDHQIEDDIHIQRSRGKDTEPMRLKEHGPMQVRAGRGHGRVETLKVANLNESTVPLRKGQQSICLLERCRNWLLDPTVHTGFQKWRGDSGMMRGRNTD